MQLLKLALPHPESLGVAGKVYSCRQFLVRLEAKLEWVVVGSGSGASWAAGPVSSLCRGKGKQLGPGGRWWGLSL